MKSRSKADFLFQEKVGLICATNIINIITMLCVYSVDYMIERLAWVGLVEVMTRTW